MLAADPPVTELQRAIRHSALYGGFQLLGLLLSLISFPILTRILTVEEYGHLALFTGTTTFLVALSKCGLTTSFVRSYAATPPEKRPALYSTALAIAAGSAILVAIVSALGLWLFGGVVDPLLRSVMQLSWGFLLATTLRELLLTFLRAEERSVALSVIGFLVKLGSLLLGIVGCVTLAMGLRGFVGGAIVFEALTVASLGAYFARRHLLRPEATSTTLGRELVAYGAPLMFNEMSWTANVYAGRFVLEHYIGAAAVGIFSVGYNLAAYVLTLITAPMSMAIFPIYTKLWETQGAEATTAFLTTVLRYYVTGSALIIVTMSATGADLIALLATPRFADAALVVPYVIASVVLFGTTLIVGAGFHLLRRTRESGVLILVCAALNITANFILVPHFGMLGSATATLLSHVALTVLLSTRARKFLPVPWPKKLTLLCAISGALAYLAAVQITAKQPFAELLLRAATACAVYTGLMLALDPALRQWAVRLTRSLAQRLGLRIP